MENLFNGCKNLSEFNLINFDTSKAKYMNGMFFG